MGAVMPAPRWAIGGGRTHVVHPREMRHERSFGTAVPLENKRVLEEAGNVGPRDYDEIIKLMINQAGGKVMARTPGAVNLTVREHGMKVVIATLKKGMAALKQENKALKVALRAAQKAAQRK